MYTGQKTFFFLNESYVICPYRTAGPIILLLPDRFFGFFLWKWGKNGLLSFSIMADFLKWIRFVIGLSGFPCKAQYRIFCTGPVVLVSILANRRGVTVIIVYIAVVYVYVKFPCRICFDCKTIHAFWRSDDRLSVFLHCFSWSHASASYAVRGGGEDVVWSFRRRSTLS